jgi:hypothetical protein
MLTTERKNKIFESIIAAAFAKATNIEIKQETQAVLVCMRDAYCKRIIAEEAIVLCSYEQAKKLVSEIEQENKEMLDECYRKYVFVSHLSADTYADLLNKRKQPKRPATFSGRC